MALSISPLQSAYACTHREITSSSSRLSVVIQKPSGQGRSKFSNLLKFGSSPVWGAGRNDMEGSRRLGRQPSYEKHRRTSVVQVSAFGGVDFQEFSLGPAAALGTAVISLLSFRAAIYFRMQYITAAMLGRHVPRGGSRVVDLNIGGGRNLYYLPKDVVQVLALNVKGNRQLLENQAVQAGVPVDVREGSLQNVSIPASSADAVISVDGLLTAGAAESAKIIAEVSRALKPGKPFIYIERARAGNPLVQALQGLSRLLRFTPGGSPLLAADLIQLIQGTKGFDVVEYETILEFADPYVVGVAIKSAAQVRESAGAAAGKMGFAEVNKRRKRGSDNK